jgi:hypothetical protein
MDRITVVSKNIATAFSPGIDLQGVVMTIKIGGGYFDPSAIDLPHSGLVFQPGAVFTKKLFYLLNRAHQKSPI